MLLNNMNQPRPGIEIARQGGVLVAINKREMKEFLPGAMLEDAVRGVERFRIVDTAQMKEQEWIDLLLESRPAVLVSAWSTPKLPERFCKKISGFLSYVCNLTGTVRHVVPRCYLEAGVRVSNWGDSISRSVAECALMHILCGLRRVAGITLALHVERQWNERNACIAIAGEVEGLFEKRVGIHGFGNVARKLVDLLKPFSVQIQSYSPGVPVELFKRKGVEQVHSIEALFSGNDVVVELEAAVPAYYKMIDERVLRMLRPGAVFVNLGRGALVDEAALARIALEGAIQIGLDVYEQEPLAQDAVFRGLPNVLLTPHIGGPTVDRRVDAGKIALRNLQNFFNGKPLEQEVTPEVYDRLT